MSKSLLTDLVFIVYRVTLRRCLPNIMSKQTVADLFPNKTFEPIGGRPNGKNLTDLQDKCLENLAAVPSILGGRQHGLAGLLLPDADYLQETGEQTTYFVQLGPLVKLLI